MDFRSHLARYSDKCSEQSLKVLSPTAVCPRDGLVFVHAPWSGFSVAAFVNLVEILHEKQRGPELFVVDADKPPCWASEAMSLDGYGELFVLKRGWVVGTFVGDNSSDFKPRLRSLLSEHIA